MMNKIWLLEHADYPIKYNLTQDAAYVDFLLENEEVKSWLNKLSDRVQRQDLSNIHGSHDYRYENIIGKCYLLGLNAETPSFHSLMQFFIHFLQKHITNTHNDTLTFGKMYQYRDYETVLSCYLPFLGYADVSAVQYVVNKRTDILYEFTRQNRYDVYRNDLNYPGIKKEWKPYILDPELYQDGNIAFPSIHDLILFAGSYAHLTKETQNKIETTVRWLFGDGYKAINESLYYYAPCDPAYQAKRINNKIHIHRFDTADPKEMQSLVYHCFLFSHFREAKKSAWFWHWQEKKRLILSPYC